MAGKSSNEDASASAHHGLEAKWWLSEVLAPDSGRGFRPGGMFVPSASHNWPLVPHRILTWPWK